MNFSSLLQSNLPSILQAIPTEWKGTTYVNSNLLGRALFCHNLMQLLGSSSSAPCRDHPQLQQNITSEQLLQVGNAEDYFRVSSNISTLLELVLAQSAGYLSVDHVFTFASSNMPIIAAAMASSSSSDSHGQPLHVFLDSFSGSQSSDQHSTHVQPPFDQSQLNILQTLNCNIVIHSSIQTYTEELALLHTCVLFLPDQKMLSVDSKHLYTIQSKFHAIITGSGVLYINDITKIKPDAVMVVRKRLATPITTPAALAWLYALAYPNEPNPDQLMQKQHAFPSSKDLPEQQDIQRFYDHLAEMSGTQIISANNAVDPHPYADNHPICFTAGLPAICSLWTACIRVGGAEILMASTAYGGSSQLTDLITERSRGALRKHTFDLQGGNDMVISISTALDQVKTRLLSDMSHVKPWTVLFVEIPTNPDMKVPDLDKLVQAIQNFKNDIPSTHSNFLLLVDTTFAPSSKIMLKLKTLDPQLPVIVFISMSKSISRGLTTAGTLLANHTTQACQLLYGTRDAAHMFDTGAKPDQVTSLVRNHQGVEDRCINAYQIAKRVGDGLIQQVQRRANKTITLAFVHPQHAEARFTSSTFSFNLPRPRNASDQDAQNLAQHFVDLICKHKDVFKACVSFGQDNGLCYATVPATSTQGAIKDQDKTKQAVDGVQLVRLSFPPSMDVDRGEKYLEEAVAAIYGHDQ